MPLLRKAVLIAAGLMLLGRPALAADGTPCAAPDQPLRPVMSTHTIPPYPEMSVMTNEDGTTLVEVHIGADGVPDDAKVATSSGSLRLDEAAVEHVKKVWRWNAPVIKCRPVAVSTRVSIKWDLRDRVDTGPKPPTIVGERADYPPGALSRHEQGNVGLLVVIKADGAVALTRVIDSSGFPELDAKAQDLITIRQRWDAAHMNGSPVNTSLYVIVTWKLDQERK